MNEKRLFSRINLRNKININIILSNKSLFNGELRNINYDSLCVVVDNCDNFELNQRVVVELKLLENTIRINAFVFRKDKISCCLILQHVSDIQSSFKLVVKEVYEIEKRGFFLTEVTAYLKDINIYGTGYFSRYFEWQGIAREEYFLTLKNADELMKSGVKLITRKAWNDYINHCFVFDKISIKIQNTNIKKYSFEMVFTFFNSSNKKIISTGGQLIAFADPSGKLMKIPQPIIDVITNHQLL